MIRHESLFSQLIVFFYRNKFKDLCAHPQYIEDILPILNSEQPMHTGKKSNTFSDKVLTPGLSY